MEASGHVDGFTDPMVDCKESKMRYRADQLFAAEVKVDGDSLGWLSLLESENMQSDADSMAESLKRKPPSRAHWSQSTYDLMMNSAQMSRLWFLSCNRQSRTPYTHQGILI